MSIRQRILKDGTTVYDVRACYKGDMAYETVRGSYTHAKRIYTRLYNELIDNRYRMPTTQNDPLFRDYAEEYKKNVTHLKDYRNVLSKIDILVAEFGKKKLSAISELDFLRFRTKRLKNGCSKATTNRDRSCLLRMLNVAVKSDSFIISKNPISNIKSLKEAPVEDRQITIEEYDKIIKVARPYFRRIIEFACRTGLRKKEITGLTFGQIKFNIDKMALELLDTKSQEREIVYLSDDMKDLILKIAKEKNVDLKNLSKEDRTKFVFSGLRKEQLKDFRRAMEWTFKEAGVKLRPFHSFRHFWTTHSLRIADPYTVMKIGRWRDIETMLKYCYSDSSKELEAVNKLSGILNQKRLEKKRIIRT